LYYSIDESKTFFSSIELPCVRKSEPFSITYSLLFLIQDLQRRAMKFGGQTIWGIVALVKGPH
jgi:hypothetical protein